MNVDVGGFLPAFATFATRRDGLDEGTECLVAILSVDETALDPRDQGQVDISNSVALVRISDNIIGEQWHSLCLGVPACIVISASLRCIILIDN